MFELAIGVQKPSNKNINRFVDEPRSACVHVVRSLTGHWKIRKLFLQIKHLLSVF